jgi:hypothetical protein
MERAASHRSPFPVSHSLVDDDIPLRRIGILPRTGLPTLNHSAGTMAFKDRHTRYRVSGPEKPGPGLQVLVRCRFGICRDFCSDHSGLLYHRGREGSLQLGYPFKRLTLSVAFFRILSTHKRPLDTEFASLSLRFRFLDGLDRLRRVENHHGTSEARYVASLGVIDLLCFRGETLPKTNNWDVPTSTTKYHVSHEPHRIIVDRLTGIMLSADKTMYGARNHNALSTSTRARQRKTDRLFEILQT